MPAVVAVAILFAACGGGAGTTTGAKGPPQHAGVLHFYPLDPGTQWSYVVRDVMGGDGLLAVKKVVAFDGTIAVLAEGETTVTLRVAPDGIVREPLHKYLLKWPIEHGAKWPGAGGGEVEVTKTDARVKVEAGEFTGCVETTERIPGDQARVIRTTFCPEVGPTMVEANSAVFVPGEPPAAVVVRLRAYGPPADFGPEPPRPKLPKPPQP